MTAEDIERALAERVRKHAEHMRGYTLPHLGGFGDGYMHALSLLERDAGFIAADAARSLAAPPADTSAPSDEFCANCGARITKDADGWRHLGVMRSLEGHPALPTPAAGDELRSSLLDVPEVGTSTVPSGESEPAIGTPEWALDYARTYWKHGLEPASQAALTILARLAAPSEGEREGLSPAVRRLAQEPVSDLAERLGRVIEVVEMYESCRPKRQSTRDVLAAVREAFDSAAGGNQ